MRGRDILDKGICWSVGNGNDIDIWQDPWIPNYPIFKLYPISQDPPLVHKVAQLINPISKTLNLDCISSLISPLDMQRILRIPIPSTNIDDKLIWSHDKKSTFTVKSTYYASLSSVSLSSSQFPVVGDSQGSQFPWNHLWTLNISPKVKHFLWCACKEALLVKENLRIMKVSVSDLCPLCKEAKETTMHCLVSCLIVTPCWFASPLCLKTTVFKYDLC